MIERRLPADRPDPGVDVALLDEHPDDLRVGRVAAAEDHRLEKRRPAEPVDVVDVDLGLEQPPDDPERSRGRRL